MAYTNSPLVAYTKLSPNHSGQRKTASVSAFSSYMVRVTISDLNIRKVPGTNYAKTDKFTGEGIFTIDAESSGAGASKWGKLESGVGWISLDYASKI